MARKKTNNNSTSNIKYADLKYVKRLIREDYLNNKQLAVVYKTTEEEVKEYRRLNDI